MTETTFSADNERGTLTASTNQFKLKSDVTANGEEKEFVEGFLATTHVDKGNDQFTEKALTEMAKDITQDQKTVDAVFNDVDTEKLKEAQVGNFDHNNNPASPFGDTRIVPAFKVVDAKVRDTNDGEKGLWVKGMLNSDGMLPDTVKAVKNSIKNDFLNAFSIEFVPKKVEKVKRNGRILRIIKNAAAKGAALTGRPMNNNAVMTDADLKSMTAQYEDKTENMELKQEYSIQTPDYSSVSESSWEKPAESDFPEEYNTLNIFIARNTESDNFSDQALPVVDWRDGEATLVLEALRSAHTLASRVEGLTEEEISRARNKIEDLAESEFDVNLGEENKADSQNVEKNNTKPMTDDNPEQGSEPEEGDEPDVQDGSGGSEEKETKSFSEDVKELKSTVEEVKETNEQLREENEDLKSELEDLKTVQDVKSDIDEVKSLLEDVELEDGARTEQEQKRFEEEETKAEWKQKADAMPEGFLKAEGASSSNMEAFAENHGIKTEEVKQYVNED